MECTVGRVENLVVEDREVEGKSETDGVGWGELGLGNVGGTLYKRLVFHLELQLMLRFAYLVGLMGSSCSSLALLSGSELSQITVVITLPKLRLTIRSWP
jgi:hypothetical protein